MRSRANFNLIAQMAAVLTSAATLKFYYSSASVNGLRWILAPTAFLVELANGERFTFEPYAGYMNADHTFVIAAPCSGVSFLIAAFLMLSIAKLARRGWKEVSWTFIPVAAAAAYLTTIAANTVRIVGAIELRRQNAEPFELTAEQVHRFEGIVVYFGFLLLLFFAAEAFGNERKTSAQILRRSLIPLFVYYAITLGVPLLNGARPDIEFMQHAIFVLVTPLLFMAPVLLIIYIRERRTAAELNC